MKKYFLMAVMTMACVMGAQAQVVFSKFKFIKDNPMGMFPTRKATDSQFKITGDKVVKYVDVMYSGVNRVGDAISSDIVGGVNANAKHTKYKMMRCAGPFEPGKSYKRWAGATFYYREKDIVAFPSMIILSYKEGADDSIKITKDNISTYFPKVKWIDVDYKDGF